VFELIIGFTIAPFSAASVHINLFSILAA